MSKFTIQVFILALALTKPFTSCPQELSDLSSMVRLKNDWYVQRSSLIRGNGFDLTSKNIQKKEWYRATVPSTVMGVLTGNGLYGNIFSGKNYSEIDKGQFDDSWWYLTEFSLPTLKPGQHVTLIFNGISYYANIWLNGELIASRDSIFGPFRRFEFDITSHIQKNNKLAVEVFKAQPGDFNLGFVDWNPRPSDENMGLWRDVLIQVTGNVNLNNTFVQSKLNTGTLKEASLTLRTTLRNYAGKPVDGFLRGKIENRDFSYPVHLEGKTTRELVLTPDQVYSLLIKNPRLWWCNNMGSPELYKLQLWFESGGFITDSDEVTFGIRDIECYTNSMGYKGFKLNGKEILIKGAGWTDDIFLRDSAASLETQVQYAKHLNLNTLRFESFWGNTDEIYSLCDKYGLLAMVGWSCQWEWEEYLGKPCDDFGGIQSDSDMDLALKSYRDQILWLRNHPSIFVWLVGSDKCPRPELEVKYQELFNNLDNRPYLASAGTRASTVSGPTGVKMNGPYEFVAPVYWYVDKVNGGAFGFNTETGPGPQVPVMESLRKMLPGDKLWPPNDTWDYHCTHSKEAFNTMNVFNHALEERYGKAANLEDYLLKSDAQSYEAVKAMFEAFRSRIPVATGIIQWMLNSAWPSLYWHLYDYYLEPSAAYYAVRKANQPVQLIYDYGDNSVYAVNETLKAASDYTASVTLLDINSKPVFHKELHLNLGPVKSEKLIVLDSIQGTVFLNLRLSGPNGKPVAGNFCWINGKPDEFDWEKTTWAYTPMKAYTDFRALNSLAESEIKAVYDVKDNGDKEIINVSLTNTSDKIAFFVSLALYDNNGERIKPVFWDDNYLSLLPGEKRIVSCDIFKNTLAGMKPRVVLSGWNIKQQNAEIK